ncbi:MAG: hypothetical protein R3A51_06260 [Nannocystaceae bacterium]
MNTLTRRLPLLLTLALWPALACDGDDGSTTDASTTDASTSDASTSTDASSSSGDSGTTAGGAGFCDQSVAANMCGADCAFDPATVDCMAACEKIAEVCASGDCDVGDACTPANQDVATCQLGCNGSKSLSCPNVVFGCYASNATCEEVGLCVDELQ